MLRISPSKFSGNPDALPSQSRPARSVIGAFRDVGPAGMGLETGVDDPPVRYDGPDELLISVGNSVGSLTLPMIHFCTSWIYWKAGILIGRFWLSSQVYVWLLASLVTSTVKMHPTHPDADMVGQVSGLQIGFPVFSSLTRMMEIIWSRRRYCSTTVMISLDLIS